MREAIAMTYQILQALAAFYLILGAFLLRVPGWPQGVLFRLVPFFLGIVLGFFVFASFMGWPV
ncbi:MAG: hypothetical protein DI604_34790 [Delftia acidovorans]|nr:MAG: hypothetical protein DI604_34790 [Delftia acidovorans]